MRLAMLLLPWLELFTLLLLGARIGALAALAYVAGTAVLGVALMRRQAQEVFTLLRDNARTGAAPLLASDHLTLGLAGLLFLVPGLLTDVAALLMLVGPARRRLLRWLGGAPERPRPTAARASRGHTIEGSFRRIDREEDS